MEPIILNLSVYHRPCCRKEAWIEIDALCIYIELRQETRPGHTNIFHRPLFLSHVLGVCILQRTWNFELKLDETFKGVTNIFHFWHINSGQKVFPRELSTLRLNSRAKSNLWIFDQGRPRECLSCLPRLDLVDYLSHWKFYEKINSKLFPWLSTWFPHW